MKLLRKDHGFTLTEIVVVIGIMGILSAIVYGSFNKARAESRDQRKVSDISNIQLSLETYFNQNHSYPVSLDTLVPQYIAILPIPPMGDKYNYFPMSIDSAGPCISYQLWIKLENGNQTALSAKKGFDSTAMQPFANGLVECGTGHTAVNASADSLIYDMVQ